MSKTELLQALPEELILELTKQMVAIPTPNPPGQEKACADFILQQFEQWGIETESIPQPDPERPQVVAWIRGSGEGPTVILNGHMDTVGIGEMQDWHVEPFSVTEKEGRLYGRGTCDMKGSLAIAMVILKTLKDSGVQFPGTLMFQAVIGEEMDEDGTRTLLKLGYTGDYAIVLEPTDLRIGPGTRGVAWHRVTLHGPSIHCGLAHVDSSDLIYRFGQLLEMFEAYHREVASKKHHLIPSPSCRITDLKAGGIHNDIAGRCEFVVDRRMVPGETYEQITEELRQILDRFVEAYSDFSYQLEFLVGNEPTETALDHPLIETLKANVESVGERKAEIWGPPYGCDMRNFVADANIPTTNFGAGDYRVCHKPNEFVERSDLMTCARIVMGTTVDLLNQLT